MSTYLVNEMYPCLQGEGTELGVPSLLVRFQICNLRCTWCDTPYTHTLKSDTKKVRRWEKDELVSEIVRTSPSKKVIFSGGEPTLWNLAPVFAGLREHNEGWNFEVETNGTQIPHKKHASFTEAHYEHAQWNISPKGKNAGESWDPESLRFWAQLSKAHPRVFFKFVVRKEFAAEDLAEVKEFEELAQPPKGRILLMPEGTTIESQIQTKWLHDICLEGDFRFSPRLHVLLFGSQRGV